MFTLLVCGAIAAGCAGGSGTSPTIPTPPPHGGVTFPPPPSEQPTNNSWQPTPGPNQENVYSYTGIITTIFVRPPVRQSPIPSPNPTVSGMLVATSAISTDVTIGNTFPTSPPINGLVEFSTAEADTGIYGQIALVDTTSQTYLSYVTDKNPKYTDVYVVGGLAQREAGTPDQTTYSTVYGRGNGLLDVVPEPTRAGRSVPVGPPNNASLTTTEKDADGQVTTRTVNPDGSYTERVTYPDGTTAMAQDTASGPTGSFSWPLEGVQPNSTVTVAAPVAGAIPITITYAPGVFGNPQQKVVKLSIPAWYPPPGKLYQQTYLNKGPTALENPFPYPYPTPNPAITGGACNLGNDNQGRLLKTLPGKPYPNLLDQVTTTVDPVFGEVETVTSHVWDIQGVGLTCSDVTDDVDQYYDFSGQTYAGPAFQNTPMQVTTVDDQTGLMSASIFSDGYYHFRRGASGTQSTARGGVSPMGAPRGGFSPLGVAGGAGRNGTSSGSASTRGAPFQGQPSSLARALMQEVLVRSERARVHRHALLWRRLRSLGLRRTF